MTITINSAISARAESYVAAVGNGIGIAHVGWVSDVKPAAAHKARSLRKSVTATVMTGVSYADLAVNAETETGELPWGTWAVAPHIIVHKDVEYARVYPVEGTVRASFFVDGLPVDRATFESMLVPSARGEKRPKAITVRLSNLTILA